MLKFCWIHRCWSEEYGRWNGWNMEEYISRFPAYSQRICRIRYEDLIYKILYCAIRTQQNCWCCTKKDAMSGWRWVLAIVDIDSLRHCVQHNTHQIFRNGTVTSARRYTYWQAHRPLEQKSTLLINAKQSEVTHKETTLLWIEDKSSISVSPLIRDWDSASTVKSCKAKQKLPEPYFIFWLAGSVYLTSTIKWHSLKYWWWHPDIRICSQGAFCEVPYSTLYDMSDILPTTIFRNL